MQGLNQKLNSESGSGAKEKRKPKISIEEFKGLFSIFWLQVMNYKQPPQKAESYHEVLRWYDQKTIMDAMDSMLSQDLRDFPSAGAIRALCRGNEPEEPSRTARSARPWHDVRWPLPAPD